MFDKLFASKSQFPFRESRNTAVFTCCHIVEGKKPILYVTHDHEGDWQFLCGEAHTAEEGRVVSLGEMCRMDSDIGLIAHLKRGQSAQRTGRNDGWVME